MKVEISGSPSDTALLTWAIEQAGGIVGGPESDVHVVFGPLTEGRKSTLTKRRTILIPADVEQLKNRSWLDLDVTWLPRNEFQAKVLPARKTAYVRWSSNEPILHSPPSPEKRIAFGLRASGIEASGFKEVSEGDKATALVCPSDLALLLRALHRGMPIFDYPHSPFREYITHGHNGYLSKDLLAPLKNTRLLRRMSCPSPAELLARQVRFIAEVREHLLRVKPKPVLFITKRVDKPPGRRFQAFAAMGAHPKRIMLPKVLEEHDYVLLGGRIDPQIAAEVKRRTEKPVILAVLDGMQVINDPDGLFSGRERWFKQIAPHLDMMFVADPPELLPKVKCPVFLLHAAPWIDCPKQGILNRPLEFPDQSYGKKLPVIFLGNHWAGNRARIIETIGQRTNVVVYGNGSGHPRAPQGPHVRYSGRIGFREAMRTMRQAKVVLSISHSCERELTSNRLFSACAVGACVLAERFPNCEKLYPKDAVCWFSSPKEAAAAAQRLCKTNTEEMRWRAQEITWRKHTHYDRMHSLRQKVEELLGVPYR